VAATERNSRGLHHESALQWPPVSLANELADLARFDVREALGSGGTGLVYEALDRDSGELVAIKTLRDVTAEALYRLKREFRMLQGREHPNLCQHYELFEHGGRWFISMERVQGVDLLTHVAAIDRDDATSIRCDERRLRAALAQLADGLCALHDAGLVHRDVKPSNVMVTPSGRVVLIDFGFVEDTGPLVAAQRSQTIVGTPVYMAPEQALATAVGPAADWFAFGVILYEALTGHVPHDGDTALAVMMNKQRSDPPRTSTLVTGVPADLDELCVDLLRADPQLRPAGSAVQRRLGEPQTPRDKKSSMSSVAFGGAFVGRATELATLHQAFTNVDRTRTITVLVEGRSGVGKTAVLRQFTEQVGESGALVLAGRCFERESVPYKAFDSAIDALAKYLRRLSEVEVAALLPRHPDLLVRMFPVLGAVRAMNTATTRAPMTEPHEQRNQAFAALRELLYRIGSRRPLVITIEDWHWADADSVVLLRDLVRHRDRPPMLVVLTSRPAENPEIAARIDALAGGDLERIELSTLVEQHAIELARQLSALFAPKLAIDLAAIVRETQGHPLYIAELVRYVATRGDHGGTAVRLDEAILARIAELPDEARSIVEALSVAGEPLPSDLVRDVVELQPTILQRQTAALRLAHLIRGGHGDGTLEPYHDRVRESVLDAMPEPKRLDWHRRIAFALESSPLARERPELLLRHLEVAGESGRAAELAVTAAQRAATAGAFDRAAGLFALALRSNVFDENRTRALRTEMGQVLANAGRGHEAAGAFLAAAEGADTPVRLDCQREAAQELIMIGEHARGIEILRTLLAEVDVNMPMTQRRALLSVIWARLKLRLRGLDWNERRATQIAPETLLRLDVFKAASHSLALIDNIRAADFNARWLLSALRVGESTRCALALSTEVMFQGSQGGRGIKRARRLLETVRRLDAEVNDPRLRAFMLMSEGALEYWACQLERADAVLTRAVRMFREETTGTSLELKTARMFHAFAMRHRGTWSQLRLFHEEYTADAERRGDLYVLTSMNRYCSVLWLANDDAPGARRIVDDATWVPPTNAFHAQHWYELEARSEIAIYQGTVAADLPALEPMFAGLERSFLLRIQSALAVSLWLRGRLAIAAGGPDVVRNVHDIIGELERIDDPRAFVAAALLGAGAAGLAGNEAAAVAKLRLADQLATDHAMRLYGAAARHQLGSLLGASEGATLVGSAESTMRAEGVANPARFADWFAPGIRRAQ
jgi:eukaryotic-like serine/threonine-protein kinase